MTSRALLRALALASAVAGSLLGLALNTHHRLDSQASPFWETLKRRYWEDTHLATGLFLHGQFPVTASTIVEYSGPDGWSRVRETRRDVERLVAREGVRPWQFWRTVGSKRFLQRPEPVSVLRRFDDAGRPVLLGLAFAALDGVAPYLLFWMGFLLTAPTVAWAAWELARAGHPRGGAAFALLLGAWPFLAETMAISYSTVGFHVLAVLLVVPLASYTALHPRPTARGLLLRAFAAGVPLAICVLCRGGALLTLPGFLLAVFVGARRATGSRPRFEVRAWGTALLATALLVAPFALGRAGIARLTAKTFAAHGEAEPPPQNHAAWYGIWAGLGDFDRTHGYAWFDMTVQKAIIANGGVPLRPGFYDPSNESLLRSMVLRDIVDDPGWYAAILSRRLLATVLQLQLRPFARDGGYSFALNDHTNQGAQSAYYAMAATAEIVGVGGRRRELPVPLVWVPLLAVLGLAGMDALRARRGGAGDASTRWVPGGALLLLGSVGLAALPLPLLITTAGGIETQAFAATYIVAAALLVDILVTRATRGGPAPGQGLVPAHTSISGIRQPSNDVPPSSTSRLTPFRG